MKTKVILSTLALTLAITTGRAQAPDDSTSTPTTNGSYRFILVRADVPLYPLVARMAHLSGKVRVHTVVKNGTVVSVSATSTASEALVNAATTNIKTWHFASDVNGILDVTYLYELEKEEDFPPANPRVEMQLPSFVKITATPPKARTLS